MIKNWKSESLPGMCGLWCLNKRSATLLALYLFKNVLNRCFLSFKLTTSYLDGDDCTSVLRIPWQYFVQLRPLLSLHFTWLPCYYFFNLWSQCWKQVLIYRRFHQHVTVYSNGTVIWSHIFEPCYKCWLENCTIGLQPISIYTESL